jgi:uncharacterized membrane protein
MNEPTATPPPVDASVRTMAVVGYALQALAFFVGITYIAAVVVAYIKRDDAVGTWLESHYRWQIRTFWYSVLWGVIGGILVVVVIGIAILFADAVWVIYRIVKGWLRLSEDKPMYVLQ